MEKNYVFRNPRDALRSNGKVLDVVLYVTQMVNILPAYDRSLLIYIVSGIMSGQCSIDSTLLVHFRRAFDYYVYFNVNMKNFEIKEHVMFLDCYPLFLLMNIKAQTMMMPIIPCFYQGSVRSFF